MSRVGTVLAQEAHIVNILSPQDVQAGVSSDVFTMKNYTHATIIVTAGTADADAGNITVKECDDFTPSNSAAIAFTYYKEETAGGDTLSEKQSATTSGIDVSANDNITYVIEIDASELSNGFPCLQLAWSVCGGATLGSAVAILSGPRYAEDQGATAIA